MNRPRVSLQLSAMLKKVGYDELCQVYYNEHSQGIQGDENAIGVNWNKHESCYSLPTLDDAARWLREVKGWHVVVMQKNNGDWMAMPETTPRSYSNLFIDNQPDHDTALSEGISLILKKLTNAQ